MTKLTSTDGTAIHFAAPAVSIVMTGPGGTTTVAASGEFLSVRESPEEVVRLIESSRQPADYAPLVDAARRLVEFLRDSDSVVTGYAPVAHALAVALAALPAREPRDGNVEVPRG